jgi:hypothetical protein
VLLVSATALVLEFASPPSASAGVQDPTWHRGANFTSWWHDEYASARSDEALARLAATGTTRVSFVPTWYSANQSSSTIAPSSTKTPSDAALLHGMAKAQELGMDVVLKPHVDLWDGSFRGTITPADPARWFADYGVMLNHYADLAQQAGARMLIVGTELSTMAGYEANWRQLIADVRARFSGELTFASMPRDAVRLVRFWDALDYIGIDAYVPLSEPSNPNPSVEELVNVWRASYTGDLASLNREWGKRILFTELGYESRIGTAVQPWGGSSGPIDQVPQQRAYEAAYRALSGIPWFQGIYWWDWRASTPSPDDGAHPFAGKLAERTVYEWNHGLNAVGPLPWMEPPLPEAAPESTVIALRVGRVGPRGRAAIVGTVRRGAEMCRGRVKIRLLRLNRVRHRWVFRSRRLVESDASGRFTLWVGPLRAGRYRTRAVVVAGSCPSARSSPVRFRVRRA